MDLIHIILNKMNLNRRFQIYILKTLFVKLPTIKLVGIQEWPKAVYIALKQLVLQLLRDLPLIMKVPEDMEVISSRREKFKQI